MGVMAGVLLALGVVVLAGSGLNPYASNTNGVPWAAGGSVTTSTTTTGRSSSTGQEGQKYLFGFAVGPAPLSQVSSIDKQPVALTGFVLLPIFAAFLLGFVLYRVSRVREEEEEPPEVA